MAVTLSDRQREIADLLLAGAERRVVRQRLGISGDSLRSHLSDIRAKLGVANDAAMMARLREWSRDPVPAVLERCRAEPREWWTC